MPFRLRPLLLVLLASLAAGLVAACGGGSGSTVAAAGPSTGVNELLRDTFARGSRLKSGKVDASVVVRAPGTAGTTRIRLTGPFAVDDAKRLPRFQFTATVQGAGQNVQGGATWTGKRAFVAFQGAQYEVPAPLARQLEAGYEESLRGQGRQKLDPAALGIHPRAWLRNARNTGERDVAGVRTIRITGDADVARALDDVQRLAARARALNLPGTSGSAQGLTPAQRREVVAAVRRLKVEVYTGKEDRILRRLVLRGDLKDPDSSQTAAVDVDLTFREVNADQDIATPSGARPLSELLSKFGALGVLGAASAGGPSAGAAKGIDAYAACVQRAGSDEAKRQACSSLLGP
jgi:hypothetical protein